MKDNYKKAMEVWEVPEEFYEAAVPMYRGYEAELAAMFGRNPVSGQEICRLLKEWGKEVLISLHCTRNLTLAIRN